MQKGRLIIMVSSFACLSASAPAQAAQPCVTRYGGYVLAPNSGAIIRIDPGQRSSAGNPVIVFRPPREHGWASQRLLMRFDLQIDDHGGRIANSGALCTEGR